MDEEISIITSETRKEKIINFFQNNKKKLFSILAIIILIPIIFYSYKIYTTGHKERLADKYNSAIINYENGEESKVIVTMKEIINDKDKTYSPLALYFLIDNGMSVSNEEINKFFDIIINKVNLDQEMKYLIIYKKGLFNSEFVDEITLIKILNPIINSESIWKSHGLYLMAEYFYSKKEKIKSKDFYEKIITLDNANPDIKIEAQKKLNRDFSE